MALIEALAPQSDTPLRDGIADLNERYADRSTHELIADAVEQHYAGRIALVSSFGAESAVLLHLVSEIDPSLPVIFLDTGRLFAETLEYRTRVTEQLGLTGVRNISPEQDRLREADPYRALWMTNSDLCCQIRKTEPLAGALEGFDAWFTGRKRFQAETRAQLPLFEAADGRIKINPLAPWTGDELKAYMAEHDLPVHPLVGRGYPSIGCVPCTSRVAEGEDERSGRWRGADKTECGIHVPMETDGSGI